MNRGYTVTSCLMTTHDSTNTMASKHPPVTRWLLGNYSLQTHQLQPDLASLQEALREPLMPARPPAARLTDSPRLQRITHPPPLLQTFSHSNPSLSPPFVSSFQSTVHSPPAHPSSRRSSLDSLRYLSSFANNAASATTNNTITTSSHSRSNSWSWWSQFVDQINAETFLSQVDAVQEEHREIKSNCMSFTARRHPMNP